MPFGRIPRKMNRIRVSLILHFLLDLFNVYVLHNIYKFNLNLLCFQTPSPESRVLGEISQLNSDIAR